MKELRFSGHDSFHCRNLWLKKGYDFINHSDKDFNDELAVIELGVGKNMVTAIRYWMDAFGLREPSEGTTNSLANKLLADDGWDPYLEDIGSLWLLHYKLVSQSHANIYSLVFNRFRKIRIEFTKEQLENYLISFCSEKGEMHSRSTIEKDVNVFIKNYVQPSKGEGDKNFEDVFASLLIELDLVKEVSNLSAKKGTVYKIASSDQATLPTEIFLYALLDYKDKQGLGESISLDKLLTGEDSPGNIFVLHPDALVKRIESLTQQYDGIVFKDDAGVRELQLTSNFDKDQILKNYYARN